MATKAPIELSEHERRVAVALYLGTPAASAAAFVRMLDATGLARLDATSKVLGEHSEAEKRTIRRIASKTDGPAPPLAARLGVK